MFTLLMSLLGSTGTVALIGFFYTLGNRVTKLETQQEDLPILLEKQFESVNQRLERIERAMNGYLSGMDH